jgi:cytosine/adenosine deaminase-related metal-dependent hydrolase
MTPSPDICVFTALLWLAFPSVAAVTVTVGSTDKQVLVGKIVTPDEVIDGKVVIQGETIKCVAVDCEEPEGASIFKVTKAFIFPGFVDAHNHVAYNVFPKWTPPKLYEHRSQWQAATAYTKFKAPYNELKKTALCEMVKYGEVKALISGVTTIQGTAPNSLCFRTLIRNAENQNELDIPAGTIRTYILDVDTFKGKVDWTKTKSFVVHIAEGIDERARSEFDTLKQKGLLNGSTAIIHGTALKEAEFEEMASVGAKLIWSPQSNLVLYGRTTDIRLAYRHGVSVSLGVDWNATGSDNLFDELRVAATVNEESLDEVIPAEDWIKLVTVNPARALGLEDQIGRLAPGLKADIVIVAGRDDNPNQSLLLSRLQDVQGVWVGGELLYASRAVIDKVKPGQCEALTVHGSPKRICVKDTKEPVAHSDQTLQQITDILRAKLPSLAPLAP